MINTHYFQSIRKVCTQFAIQSLQISYELIFFISTFFFVKSMFCFNWFECVWRCVMFATSTELKPITHWTTEKNICKVWEKEENKCHNQLSDYGFVHLLQFCTKTISINISIEKKYMNEISWYGGMCACFINRSATSPDWYKIRHLHTYMNINATVLQCNQTKNDINTAQLNTNWLKLLISKMEMLFIWYRIISLCTYVLLFLRFVLFCSVLLCFWLIWLLLYCQLYFFHIQITLRMVIL